jgi:hypothetical protein
MCPSWLSSQSVLCLHCSQLIFDIDITCITVLNLKQYTNQMFSIGDKLITFRKKKINDILIVQRHITNLDN